MSISPNKAARNPKRRPRLIDCRGFSVRAAVDAFARVMCRDGVDPGAPITPDGVLHRFKTPQAKGWYVFHEHFDHAWGAYGNYRTGDEWSWSSRRLTPDERSRVEQERQTSAAATEDRDSWKTRDALRVWQHTPEAPLNHPYLKRKHVRPHGVHFYHRGNRVIAGVPVAGSIVVPVFDDDEELQAVQFITADGDKLNIGPTSGGHFWIGEPKRGRTLYLAEGFATGASVYEDTTYTCCVAFGIGGYDHAARYIRDKFEPKKLVIVADGDEPGIRAANAAARAVDGRVFECDPGMDFNDMVLGGRLA